MSGPPPPGGVPTPTSSKILPQVKAQVAQNSPEAQATATHLWDSAQGSPQPLMPLASQGVCLPRWLPCPPHSPAYLHPLCPTAQNTGVGGHGEQEKDKENHRRDTPPPSWSWGAP